MDLLNFTETPATDETIEEYEYHEYEPITGTILITQDRSGSLFKIFTHQDHYSKYLLIRLIEEPKPKKN